MQGPEATPVPEQSLSPVHINNYYLPTHSTPINLPVRIKHRVLYFPNNYHPAELIEVINVVASFANPP